MGVQSPTRPANAVMSASPTVRPRVRMTLPISKSSRYRPMLLPVLVRARDGGRGNETPGKCRLVDLRGVHRPLGYEVSAARHLEAREFADAEGDDLLRRCLGAG